MVHCITRAIQQQTSNQDKRESDLYHELVANLELDHADDKVGLGPEHRELPLAGELGVERGPGGGGEEGGSWEGERGG